MQERGKRQRGFLHSVMDSVERKPATVAVLPGRCVKQQDSLSSLRKGISMVLSRWTGLQMAIQNQWGGRDSLKKSEQLASDVLFLFSRSKAPICVDDLESLLHESLLLALNTEIEDGSIEEVAEQLIILHEEYLQGTH